MQILANLPDDKLIQFSKMSGQNFKSFSNATSESVALVIEGESFTQDISKAVSLNIPVVVVAGSIPNNQFQVQEALDYGIPGECIIVKKGQEITSIKGYSYDQSDRGISVKAIITACQYVFRNKLLPLEMFIWEENKTIMEVKEQKTRRPEASSVTSIDAIKQPVESNRQDRAVVARGSQKAELSKKTIGVPSEETLTSILDLAENIIVVFKTIPDSNSGQIAQKITRSLNSTHVEISGSPENYNLYEPDLNQAISTGQYAYYDGETVHISNQYSGCKWLIVEVDPDMMDVADAVYQRASQVVHVVPDYDKSHNSIEAWIEAGFKLTAIITETPDALRPMKNKFGDKVKSVEDFISSIAI